MGLLTKIFGDPNDKIVKNLQPIVDKINSLEKKYQAMTDEELRSQTQEFRKRLGVETGEAEAKLLPNETTERSLASKLEEILPDAFAVVREAAKRTLGQRHFDVQLMGAIVLHRGQIAEMKTGEGKTLVATLAVYLNALPAQGVHVITVNDYLAKRDAAWMGMVYDFLGLTVGCITHEKAYKFSLDPNFQFSISNFQTDSNDQNSNNQNKSKLVEVPRKEAYNCDILYGTNNEFGFDYLRDNMAPDLDRMVQRDLNYAIVDEVDSILIDEARTPLIISAPAEESTEKYFKFAELVRRLKENDPATGSGQGDYNIDEKMRAATLTEAGLVKMEKMLGIDNIYAAGGGMSEVHHIEQALKAMALFKRDRDYVVKEGEVIIVDEFTGRLMYGRRYSEGLHQAIEAKEGVQVQRESQTLATITFQNYFRMYAKLAGMTGTAVTEAEEFAKIYKLETVAIPTNKPMIRRDLNDLIYRSENGKFKAVIEEIEERSKAGQPVLVGTISIEKNEILGEMLEREGIKPQILNAKHHEKEASIIAQAGKAGTVTIATNMAGRGVDIILGGSPLDEGEREKVVRLGGLHVIGTERHESRRIDNQLRGRSGRQGDPGSSQFYVSMEDDLMRIFGGDRMKSLMTTLKLPEDMPIANKMVSKSIESAQAKVEGNNFDIRKHLVEYDDVINKHRESIYKRRREILEMAGNPPNPLYPQSSDGAKQGGEIPPTPLIKMGEGGSIRDDAKSLSSTILSMVENEIEQVVIFHTAAENIKDWNLAEIYQVASTIFPVEKKLREDLSNFTEDGGKLDKIKERTAIIEHLIKLAQENYQKLAELAGQAGIIWSEIEKAILIRSIDTLWMEHLDAMDQMRRGIGLRGYGQRDPLVEYKKEAYRMYNELNSLIQKQVVYTIFKVGDIGQFKLAQEDRRPKQFIAPAKEMSQGSSSFSAFKTSSGKQKDNTTINLVKDKVRDSSGRKVGRNDPCPCGAKKPDGTPIKFKHCCGK